MINLLPLREKKENEQEENWKIVLVLGILVLVFLFSLSLILFSIKISVVGQTTAQEILLSQKEKEINMPQVLELEEKIKKNNLTFSKLKTFYLKNPDLTETLERISKTLPPAAYLTGLSLIFQPEKEQAWTCSLSGFSPSREILIKFKENLEKEKDFKEIHFPPANWLEPTDINFSVSFQIAL